MYMATTAESMTDITCLCVRMSARVCVVVHMNVFDPGQRNSFHSFRGTSRAVTLCCIDMILAVFKMENEVGLQASGLLDAGTKEGLLSKHTMSFVLSLFLLLSCGSFILSTLYSQTCLRSLLHSLFNFLVSSAAGGLQNQGGSADLGGGAVRQWLHASRYGTVHC